MYDVHCQQKLATPHTRRRSAQLKKMKITVDEIEPIEKYSYLEVGTGQSNNGKPIIIHKQLPIYLGEFES